jgi:hypothetical protein
VALNEQNSPELNWRKSYRSNSTWAGSATRRHHITTVVYDHGGNPTYQDYSLKEHPYALREAKAEAFADDTTLFMTRSPENLRGATKYIQDFHTISGQACNLERKKHIIPIGIKNDPTDFICPDLGMTT